MGDESKRISNLAIDAAIIGVAAVGAASIGNAITSKLHKPKLAVISYDLSMNIIYISLGRHLRALLHDTKILPLIR